jgi:hypothetical protein
LEKPLTFMAPAQGRKRMRDRARLMSPTLNLIYLSPTHSSRTAENRAATMTSRRFM